MTIDQFLDRVVELSACGVSLESCFFDDFSQSAIDALKEKLDRRGLERVWAWGHPRGLESGANEDALDDLIAHVDLAARLGAGVMRICAGGRGTRPESWTQHKKALLPMLGEAAGVADRLRRGDCRVRGGRAVTKAIHYTEQGALTLDAGRDRLIATDVLAGAWTSRRRPFDRSPPALFKHEPAPTSTSR